MVDMNAEFQNLLNCAGLVVIGFGLMVCALCGLVALIAAYCVRDGKRKEAQEIESASAVAHAAILEKVTLPFGF